MGLGLIFTREVQVDIRLFIAVEAQEGFEGDIVTIPVHGSAAVRTVLGGQVKARLHRTIGEELTVLAVGADIVGHQRIDL